MKHKRGDKRSDGMVFMSYTRGGKGQWWVTEEKFGEIKQRERRKHEERKQKIRRIPKEKRLSRGDTRPDGKVFWGYSATASGGQVWLSREKFNSRKEWKKKHNENWCQANKDRMNYLKRRWDKNNPEKFKASQIQQRLARRARKKTNGGTVSKKELTELKAKSLGRCYYCGEKKKLSYDHVVPLKMGGRNSIDNLVMACINCNSQKQAQDPVVYAQKIGRLII